MMQITTVVKQLLIINIIFFVGSMAVPHASEYLALYFFKNEQFGFWQLLTHMFMHGNILHIAFNMFALYSFGSTLEHFWGGKKFLFFYISCGLGAAVLHSAVNYFLYERGLSHLQEIGLGSQAADFLATGNLSFSGVRPAGLDENVLKDMFQAYNGSAVGASGAIYGLLVAFAFMFPNTPLFLMFIPIPIKAKFFVPAILLYDLFAGVKGGGIFGGSDGIAHFAHLGGAILGFLMMWYWKKNSFNDNRWN